MAKLIGPLFSLSAHGSISRVLRFCRRASGDQVRSQHSPHNVKSSSQLLQRSLFLQARDHYVSLLPSEKLLWHLYNDS